MSDTRNAPLEFHLDVHPSHEATSVARREVRRRLEASTLAVALVDDVELVLAELLANAVDQAPTRPVRVDVSIGPDSVDLSVVNRAAPGSAFDDAGADGDPLDGDEGGDDDELGLAARGRGLAIVRALTDGLWVDRRDDWTVVSCSLTDRSR